MPVPRSFRHATLLLSTLILALSSLGCSDGARNGAPPAAPEPDEIWNPGDVSLIARQFIDDDPVVRRDALRELSERWPESARAIPCVVASLSDEDAEVREAAAATLESMRQRALPVLTAYVASIATDRGPGTRFRLKYLDPGKTILDPELPFPDYAWYRLPEGLARELTGEEEWKQLLATSAVLEETEFDGMPQEGVLQQEGVLPLLKNRECADLAAAALAHGAWVVARERGLIPEQVLGEIPSVWRRAIRSRDPYLVLLAARFFASWGKGGSWSDTAVYSALRENVEYARTPPTVRRALARGYGVVAGRAGTGLGQGVPDSIKSEPRVVAEYARGLCRFASEKQAARFVALPWLAPAAAHRLGRADSTPPEALEGLSRLVRETEIVDPFAALALSRIGGIDDEDARTLDERAAHVLDEADWVRGDDDWVRRDADWKAEILEYRDLVLSACCLGGVTDARIDALIEAATTRSQGLRWIAETCAELGPVGQEVLVRMREVALQNKATADAFRAEHDDRLFPPAHQYDIGWRLVAAALGPEGGEFALGLAADATRREYGPEPGDDPWSIQQAFNDVSDARRRVLSLRALIQIGPAGKHAAPIVRTLLHDRDWRIALWAARALRAMR